MRTGVIHSRGEICPMPFGLSDAQLHAVMLALAPLDPSKRAESPTLRAASWSKFPPLLSEEEWAEKVRWIIDPSDRSKADQAVTEIVWSPRGNPAQRALLECQVFEVFFGGARGGGIRRSALPQCQVFAPRAERPATPQPSSRSRCDN